jgi:phosphoglycolate phosphatase-like HAD superfamily hydrolase
MVSTPDRYVPLMSIEALDCHAAPDRRLNGDWMYELGRHFRAMRERYPTDQLCIVFDIDGTIIDTRYLVRTILLESDRHWGTNDFRFLTVDDVDVYEGNIEPLLEQWVSDPDHRRRVRAYFRSELWHPRTTLNANQPYPGVMELIRWFQLQRDTVVALVTGRPEALRASTLGAFDSLTVDYRVRVASENLLMHQRPQDQAVALGKVEALHQLVRRGYRLTAVIDNEPVNLDAMAGADESGDVIFLHADTIFQSTKRPLIRAYAGRDYDLGCLVTESDLGEHTMLVHASVDTASRLEAAVAGPVDWIELPILIDPYGCIEMPGDLDAMGTLSSIRRAGKAVRLDLRAAGVAEQASLLLRASSFTDDRVWFSGNIDVLGRTEFQCLREAWPSAIISTALDDLSALVFAVPETTRDTLGLLHRWGVNRVSIDWGLPQARRLLARLESWGYDVDVRVVGERASAMAAAVLLPTSVTSAAFRTVV